MTTIRTPRRGERVRVDYYEGKFLVVRIDKIDNVAKVERWGNPDVALWDVSVGAIHLIREPESEAA
jgi:hypothetical protein